jgi:drug/metabolite transporter (DMT)-like permease
MPLSDNMRGALLMMASMAAFTVNDTFFKTVAEEVPLLQAIMIRGAMTTILLAVMAVVRGAWLVRIPLADWKIIGWRTFAEIGSTYFFLSALFHMPIANLSAILQSLPLAITLAGALFFREKVGWRRYGAIAIGFCGVLLIVRPGTSGFDIYSLYGLIAVAFVVLRDLSTHRLSRAVPSVSVALITAVAITSFGAFGSAIEGWQPVEFASVARLSGAAFFIVGGYLLSIMVMRVGEIAVVSPFRYTALIWAITLGYLVFGNVPSRWTIIGSIIVVGMGIYTFYREHKLQKRIA